MKRLLVLSIFILTLSPLYSQYGGSSFSSSTSYLGINSTQGIFTNLTYNDGSITSASSATVYIIGSVPNTQHQLLAKTGGATATQIGNIILNNGTGGLFVNNPATGLEVLNNFNFNGQNSQVTTPRNAGALASNNLHIDANAAISGSNGTNNVNGYLKKDGDAAGFVFSLADGTAYGPMSVGSFGAGNSIVAAYYHSSPASAGAFENGPFSITSVIPAYLNVSSQEYWNVLSKGSPNASLTLTFRGDYSQTTNVTLYILGWKTITGQWEQIPNTLPTGLTAGNSISSTATVNFSDYSAFTLGYILPPTVMAVATAEKCNLSNASITATGNRGVPPYKYSIDGVTFQTATVFPGLGAGNYTVTIRDSYGLKGATTATIIDIPPGKVFAGNDTSIAINQPVQLHAADVSGQGYTIFNWSPPVGLNDPSLQNPITTLQNSTTYTVIATAPNGCQGTASITLKVYPGPEIYVPNAFTPNGDGKNDILKAIPIGLSRFKYFSVYNRFGERIFYTNNAGTGWDGYLAGHALNTDTFVWVAEGIDGSGRTILRKGTVVLIR